MADKVICPVCEEDFCKEDEPEFCSKCQKPAHCWCVTKIGETQLCGICYDKNKNDSNPSSSYTLLSPIQDRSKMEVRSVEDGGEIENNNKKKKRNNLVASKSRDQIENLGRVTSEIKLISNQIGKKAGGVDDLKANLFAQAKKIMKDDRNIDQGMNITKLYIYIYIYI